VQTARLIVEAALRRKESRGGHYRSDFPRAESKWRGRHIEL
jgi:L-aspartate oxidase